MCRRLTEAKSCGGIMISDEAAFAVRPSADAQQIKEE
jgi:hypothetical protein